VTRAVYLLNVAVQSGVNEQWFREARALLCYLARDPIGGTCENCQHQEHEGELCGADSGDGATCLCALERSNDATE
jgi:hypothetical protein